MKAPTKAQLSADLAKALKVVARLTKACDLARDDVDKARDDVSKAQVSLATAGANCAQALVERDQALADVETLKAERDYLQKGMDVSREIIDRHKYWKEENTRQFMDARARLGLARMLAAAGQTDLLLRSLES